MADTVNPIPTDQATAEQFFKMISAQSVATLNQNVALLLKAQGQAPAVDPAPAPAPAPSPSPVPS